jgi:hypothetical protein
MYRRDLIEQACHSLGIAHIAGDEGGGNSAVLW